MTTNQFLQRFKGKTQQIGKQGIRNALSDGNPDIVVQTNTNNKYRTTNNSVKPIPKNQVIPIIQKPPLPLPTKLNTNNQIKKQNPFLVSNPFYLDQQERERQQKQKRQLRKIQEAQKPKPDPKSTVKNTTAKSLEKKSKGQWVKLGGLGANIGGDDWLQKKKKLDKMQEFAGQVKSINSEKIKPISNQPKQEKKEPNARQKALQYSKNVPKPQPRKYEEEEQVVQQLQPQKDQNELTELQLYAAKHQKLKNLLKNQY